MKGRQIDLFNDRIVLFVCLGDKSKQVCTYYSYEKARNELITWLAKGACAWMNTNGRKTEFRRIKKDSDWGFSSMETLE